MRFTEIDLFGVYVAPISLMMVAAWVVMIGLRGSAARFGLLRHVWHPALFVFAVYMIVLSSIVLVAAREAAMSNVEAQIRPRSPRRASRKVRPASASAGARPRHAGSRVRILPLLITLVAVALAVPLGLGDVGRLYGGAVDARRHGARLCRHDGAGGLGADRRAAGCRQPVRAQGRSADGDRPDQLRDRRQPAEAAVQQAQANAQNAAARGQAPRAS